MTPHEDDENLSAFIDGELDGAASGRIGAHVSSCAECRGRLESLRAAGAAFRRSGVRDMPAGLATRAKAAAAGGWRPVVRALAWAVGVLAVAVFAGGIALKKFMPTLFNSVQQMITGAASTMGSGGK